MAIEVKIKSSFEAKLACIKEAFLKGWEVNDPTKQHAQFIRLGVGFMREGHLASDITPEMVSDWEKAGGTDHPDPTLRSV